MKTEIRQKAAARSRLIEEYENFVCSMAGYLVSILHLPPDLYDECVSAGYVGLVEAAQRYDYSRDVSFKSFAFLRVRGAMIDAVRAAAPVPHQVFRLLKSLDAVRELRRTEAGDGDVADKELEKILEYAAKAVLIHRLSYYDNLDEILEVPDQDAPPDLKFELEEEGKLMRRCLGRLPQKERDLLEFYYYQGMTFLQIGKLWGVSKSWVCRLHAKGIRRLRRVYLEELSN